MQFRNHLFSAKFLTKTMTWMNKEIGNMESHSISDTCELIKNKIIKLEGMR